MDVYDGVANDVAMLQVAEECGGLNGFLTGDAQSEPRLSTSRALHNSACLTHQQPKTARNLM